MEFLSAPLVGLIDHAVTGCLNREAFYGVRSHEAVKVILVTLIDNI